ncbi:MULTISPECIES: sigma 54-interacting transcriptional regulator [Sporomusa]|jgi:transcriptional regulator with PAS, ATPase and Fis domain|uniref:sigma-54 interaction domain-containing protein n=1 Tax=Sporomusa TaxID=2375 RepID=UPI0031592A98
MYDEQTKILLEALPMIAKITGGYATLTDSNGVMITNYDYKGEELSQFKNQVYEMATRCIKEKRPLIGPARYDQNCMAWAVPINNYVLVSTDTQRIRNEENLKEAMKKALPGIARIAGGYATMCDKMGQRIISFDSNGQQVEVAGDFEQARRSITSKEPIVTMSTQAEGVYVAYIPITSDCCLILNNATTSKKSIKLMQEVKRLQNTKYNICDIIGESQAIKRTLSETVRIARSNSTVLLVGETGTGKEMFAQAIHNASHSGGPFVAINCGALPDSLIESHLFGYEEGAFTGAKKGGMLGSFEQADGGTIFLDEINELDFNLQSKLLRVLQEKEVTRIGGSKPIRVNTRVISATNKNLRELVKEKKFREDLYYRLDVIRITIPPLREREGDVTRLAEYFLNKYNTNLGRVIKQIGNEAMEALQKYNWPGNVRELENTIEFAVNVAEYTEIEILLHHLPQHIILHNQKIKEVSKASLYENGRTLDDYVMEYEKEIIKIALENAKYKSSLAAKRLGVSVSTLWRKMQKYGINV